MQFKIRTQIKPKRNRAKRLVVEAGFLALGRGLQSASYIDETVQYELNSWPEDFCFEMRVLPQGPKLRMYKTRGAFAFASASQQADLVVELKNLETAFQMITTQAGIPQVYANHGIGVVGNIARSMSLIRMINVVEAYLFPEFLSKNILKRVPAMTLRKHLNRMHLLTVGMITGR